MSYEPFKCPDCGTWWRGETHRCPDAPTTRVKKDIYTRTKDLDLCIRCGRTYNIKEPHSCVLDDYRYKRPRQDNWPSTPKDQGHKPKFPPVWYNKDFEE